MDGVYPLDGSGASDGWKAGRELGLPYAGMVDRGDYKITGLHPKKGVPKTDIPFILEINYIAFMTAV